MCECVELLTEIIDALQSFAETVVFLFSGLSFGLIPSITDIQTKEDNLKFGIILSNASHSLYAIYLTVLLIISMYYDFNSVANVIALSIALLTTIWFISLLKHKKEKILAAGTIHAPLYWTHYSSTIVLCIRLSLNTYFLVYHILQDTSSWIYIFHTISVSFDCLFLLLFTLVLYLPLMIVDEHRKQGKKVLSVWAMEYGDIIAHLVVCITYATTKHAWDGYLVGYFIVYSANTLLFPLFLPSIMHSEVTNGHHPMILHTLFLDLVTDLPFTIITLSGKTYVGNIIITLDLVMNIITFIRGVIWVPVKFKDEERNILEVVKSISVFYVQIIVMVLICIVIWSVPMIVFSFITETECGDVSNPPWSDWFEISGFILFFLMLFCACATTQFCFQCISLTTGAWEYVSIATGMIVCSIFVVSLVMGILGFVSYGESSSGCKGTIDGTMVLLYSILMICCAVGSMPFGAYISYLYDNPPVTNK